MIEALSHPRTRAYVCSNGFLLVSRITRKSAYLWKVASKVHRQGTARRLVAHAFRRHPQVTRWSAWIDDRNAASISLFSSLGFVPGEASEGGKTWRLTRRT